MKRIKSLIVCLLLVLSISLVSAQEETSDLDSARAAISSFF